MDLFDNLILGFSVAATLVNLSYCLLGTFVGTVVGVLPGIGAFVAIALLLPATYTLEPTAAMIMLAGIYYGAQYGGSTTAILVNLPGESASVVTCLDGYAMARQGRGGAALGVAALASFFAGCVATVVIVLFAPLLVDIALKFGSAEYFSLMVLGLVSAVVLAHGSVLKALAMTFLGILLGFVGTDLNSSVVRLTFGIHPLTDGLNFVVIAMGVFGLGEIIANLQRYAGRSAPMAKVQSLMPTRSDFRQSWKPVLRGTAIGSLFGVLPGAGPTISAFSAYTVEKKLAKDPSRFGRGAVEGVAAPEAANNAASQTAFIPTLTLGIPGSGTMVLILGALWIQGILPGPKLMVEKPELFWGLIASMWIGNLMLLVLNLPMIGLWTRLLTVPYRLLYPAILLFICIGAYSLNNNPFDVGLVLFFGLFGYVFILLGCEGAPLLLGFVLGPMLEQNLRRTLIIARGDPMVFIEKPISLAFLLAALALLCLVLAPAIRRKRAEAFVEEGK